MALHRDVANRVLAFADIDTRRTLGVYTRLCVPEALAANISRTLNVPKDIGDHEVSISLGPSKVVAESTDGAYETPMFRIFRMFDIDGRCVLNGVSYCAEATHREGIVSRVWLDDGEEDNEPYPEDADPNYDPEYEAMGVFGMMAAAHHGW